MPQVPDVPEDEETADEIFVTGPEGERFSIELPEFEPSDHKRRPRRPGDPIFDR